MHVSLTHSRLSLRKYGFSTPVFTLAPLTCSYPFLLVDRVIEWEKEKYAIGYKNVTINDNFFTGHFPERPIMPGEGWCGHGEVWEKCG